MGKSQESKTIGYQDILELRTYLRELKTWHSTLHFMPYFLDANVKRRPQEIQACAEMFEVVYQTLDTLIASADEHLTTLVEAT
ncbi:hypothetical protein [Enterococcus termitis]|uniref:Uncharacterized protein n=1 Tax=Enterococcus termitis TaxID=332950 RepID=A0A1E5G8T9_9ENTE|nr:hypothetical protein [Enterococcus termitis]OEG09133.1 hypothetical protein BCR25_11220 [Enterococcus termitis]OJG98590.1 hypothetical protein RV18_GL003013 [Enterococcus termitis]